MKRSATLNYYEISSFCRQMARLFGAGIGPHQALSILREDTEDPRYNAFLAETTARLEEGKNFHEALSASGLFPDYVLSLMRLGEETGSLDIVSDSLASYYEKEDALRDNIRSAVVYPVIMLLLMLAVILVVLRYVLPVFQQVFQELGTSMTGVSALLLAFGTNLSRYSVILYLLLALLIGFTLYVTLSDSGRHLLGRLLDRFGPTRRFREQLACGRFASGMALALKSGLRTRESMDLAAGIVENDDVRARILRSAEQIELGMPLKDALEETGLFNHFHLRMLEVSSRTGNTDEVLQEIAEEYHRAADRRLSSVVSAIEPTLVIILSLVIGAILLSVILPLLGILSDIG